MSTELSQIAASDGAPAWSWKPYHAYRDSGVEWQDEHGSKAFYIFQTRLTGSTGFVSSFDPVHYVILSRKEEPQLIDLRLIANKLWRVAV